MSTLAATALLTWFAAPTANAQSMTKKTRHIEVSRVMDHDASAVWTVIAGDYGRIADSHPRIVASEYTHGSLTGELGAQRLCYFNDRHTRLLHEEIVDFDEAGMTFSNRVLDARGFPVDEDNTLAVYRVEPLPNGGSRLTMSMEFRTKPAMMGAMAKGGFTQLMEDYLLSVDHHLATGESVTRDNFRQVAKLYQ